jgi:hypothetical protein
MKWHYYIASYCVGALLVHVIPFVAPGMPIDIVPMPLGDLTPLKILYRHPLKCLELLLKV